MKFNIDSKSPTIVDIIIMGTAAGLSSSSTNYKACVQCDHAVRNGINHSQSRHGLETRQIQSVCNELRFYVKFAHIF